MHFQSMRFGRGFTLIELLVVIAIIGILASVVLASLNLARVKARDAQRIAAIRQIQNALQLYYTDNGTYPGSSGNGSLSALDVLIPDYISEIPNDPQNSGATPTWSWANANTYYYWGTGNVGACGPFGYTLWYRMENNSNGNAESCINLDSNSFTVHP